MCHRIVDRLDVPEDGRAALERLIAECPIGGRARVQVTLAAVAGGVFGVVLGAISGGLLAIPVSMSVPGLVSALRVLPVVAAGLGAVIGAVFVGRHQVDDARAAAVERRLVARACLRCGAGVLGVPVDPGVSHAVVRCPECGETTVRVSGPPGRALRRTGDAAA